VYADDFISAIQGGGWTSKSPPFLIEERTGQGVKIVVHDVNSPPPGAIQLQQALKQIGITADGASIDTVGPSDLYLYIGVQ
jgi:hypothetical protein